MNDQTRFEYQTVDTVLNALIVGGLAVTGALMLVLHGAQPLVA